MNRRTLNHKYLAVKHDEHRGRLNRYSNWEINSGNTTDGSMVIRTSRNIHTRSVVNYKIDSINSKSQHINGHVYKDTLEYKIEQMFGEGAFDE